MENTQIDLKKFDMNKLRYNQDGTFLNPCIAMIAKRNSGKSWLIRDIMYNLKDIPGGCIIAPTDKMSGFYKNFVPESYIYYEYNNDIIPKILKRQLIMATDNELRKKSGKTPKDSRIFFIMDDCMASKHLWLKDPNILTIFNNGRWYNISYILSMLYALGIPPELRANFDYVFLLREDYTSNKKRLYDHYAGIFPTYDIFDKIFCLVTEDYGALVIDNRCKSNKILDKVFWYKAKDREKFMTGCDKFKEYNDRNLDKDYDKKNKYNFNNTNKKTNILVNLKKK